MSVGLVTILFGVVGAGAVIIVLGQLWSIGGTAEEPVGPWSIPRPDTVSSPLIPRDFNTLIWGDAIGWERPEQWNALVYRLGELERELGGIPGSELAPPEYSPVWLARRLEQLEQLSGPLPSPIRRSHETP